MKIIDLSLSVIELPFRFSFNHNLAKRSFSQNLIVKVTIETEKGIAIGFGEGIPREYVTGETIAQSISCLEEQYFPRFKGKEFSNIAELIAYIMDQFSSCGLEERANGASWCALELALLDAASRTNNISIGYLLAPGNKNLAGGIRYGATASLTNKKVLAVLLTCFRLYGFTTVKLKLGKNLDDAIERVVLARRIMGANATIRVDANCAWSVINTLEFSKRCAIYNVASIEQPLEASNIEGISQLASAIDQAIVLDESVCTIKQAKYFVENGIKVDFNIRISKMGGLLAASTIKNIANNAGIQCHLGAQVGESSILTAAGRIFALSNGPFVNYEGAANNFLLKHDLAKENLTFGYGGYAELPKQSLQAGLGITINEQKLENLISKENTTINELNHLVVNSVDSNKLVNIEKCVGSKQ